MVKISFITPKPPHKIYQNRLVYDELKKRGWKLQYNKVDKTTTHLLCTSNSQFRRTDELAKKWNLPYITWIADIGLTLPAEKQVEELREYIHHIRKSWKAISICSKMQWEAITLSGRYRIDLVKPCIDNHTIKEICAKKPKKKNQIVVVGAMAPHKEPHIPFLAWKELEEPRPDLIYISYGILTKKQINNIFKGKPEIDKKAISIEGLFAPQLVAEAKKYKNKVKFIACGDKLKFKIMAESMMLIMPDSYGGFNLPPIEAYYCGTPSIISDAHWFSDLPFKTYKTNDVYDLALKIKTYLSCLKRTKGKFPPDKSGKLETYTIEKCADRLEQKFKEWGLEK